MSGKQNDAKALRLVDKLANAHNWKHLARRHGLGYYELQTDDTGDVPVRLFLTPQLSSDAEDILYRQIVNATRFPGVRMVVITPDTHYGYGVPVGCVLITDADAGAVAMGPVGYDIGCFTADTLVPTVDGNAYPIGELAECGREIFVYALSAENKVVVAKATAKKTRDEGAAGESHARQRARNLLHARPRVHAPRRKLPAGPGASAGHVPDAFL